MIQPHYRVRAKVTRGIMRRALTGEWLTFEQIADRADIRERGSVPESSARTALRYLVTAGEAEAKWRGGADSSFERRRVYRRSQS